MPKQNVKPQAKEWNGELLPLDIPVPIVRGEEDTHEIKVCSIEDGLLRQLERGHLKVLWKF